MFHSTALFPHGPRIDWECFDEMVSLPRPQLLLVSTLPHCSPTVPLSIKSVSIKWCLLQELNYESPFYRIVSARFPYRLRVFRWNGVSSKTSITSLHCTALFPHVFRQDLANSHWLPFPPSFRRTSIWVRTPAARALFPALVVCWSATSASVCTAWTGGPWGTTLVGPSTLRARAPHNPSC